MYKHLGPEHFKRRFELPENYVVSGFLSCGAWNVRKQLTKLKRGLKQLSVKYKIKKLKHFLCNVYEIEINGKIFWFTCLYGGAMLSEYTHLACIFGSKSNIHIGSCGALYPEITSLDYLIPEWSYGDDSITRSYIRDNSTNKYFSNKNLSKKLEDKLNLKEGNIWKGPIINCQAMLGETKDDIENWSKEGYYGVEMEISTVFSVSNHFKIPCASLLYVSDNLINGQIAGDKSHIELKKVRGKISDNVYRAAILTMMI